MGTSLFSSLGTAPSLFFLGILWLCAIDCTLGEDTSFYKSRPDIYPPVFNIERTNPDKLSPGYIFITPYELQNPGPYIYDNTGELVWSGWGISGPGNAHGLHVCKYKGADHLCFFQGNQQKGYCRGHGIIMDNNYRVVRSVQPGGGMASSDMHEFRPINDGKTALMTIYQQRQFDMTPWNVKTGVGWLMESVFQEIDVETNDVLFEWRSLDHVDPSSSYTWPAHTDTSGTGLNVHEPWDYFHINSVDKNAAGDYLISSRHTSAIYKVSGKDGSVMWRLHGAQPSFRNINFSFSQQHDARWLYENATHTLLSLYNNGYNGFNKTHTYSAGMIIMIDHVEKTATQLRDYAPIRDDLVSSSQGNLQMLPNQNAFIGWGNNPFVSEHDEAGNLLFWGSFAKDTVMNYRAMKFEWDGAPTDSPALWTYSRSAETSSTTSFYVSWNGATRVQTWRFWGAMNATGPWTLLDEVSKTGFETKYSTPKFYLWSKVEAVDREGILLGKSETKYTFVPSSELREFCAESTCLDAPGYGFPGEEAARPFIPPVGVNTVPWIDPNNPGSNIYTHPSGYAGPAGTPKYSDRWRNGRLLAWGAVLLVAIPLFAGIFLAHRYYTRHSLTQLRDQESSTPVDGTAERKHPPVQATDLRWWNWRRWVGEDETTSYFPLVERSLYGHRRERERIE
ncbi:hypothetical protein DTO013E5_3279 [Penicillium roqueforti]|uniref:Genomic scaffold, ProqFM164S03 n=1 Tax=Penicillium roqueforti (strain FM164) TaxID=1365484 RepID=W6QFS9_PENRF|nr:uncharacterized protein LCP9604111_5953 [Penicillium roqueforti]CDM34811.1 unnamed protein product [Penicillium roqueforti FM164]KAF9247763.1 hypothetical protein LCP9604111_5953 [Penicillium roqueforti]KAI1837044.1 hypothetical protein CBS147337_2296 [Penicillium roqueforti]KAI2678100.1 hypothetical protein CBS147355_5101 [Penicillium roqueforti]KAI2686551.1 hypothetical protein LCP963914a_4151 [Penicillium roqueforti]